MKYRTLILVLLAVAISAFPLFLLRDTEFEGADAKAGELIAAAAPDYRPWFSGIWEPPGGEVESLLFSLQAAFGAGIICFLFGFYAGRKSRRKERPIVRP